MCSERQNGKSQKSATLQRFEATENDGSSWLEATGLNLNVYVIFGCVGGVAFNLHNQ